MSRQADAATKAAALQLVERLQSTGHSQSSAINTVASQYGISDQTIRNWISGRHLNVRTRTPLETRLLPYVVACGGNIAKAYELAKRRGEFEGSLSSFRRRFAAVDTDLAAAAREGIAAMIQLGLYNVAGGDRSRGDVFHFDHTEVPVEVLTGTKRIKVWVSLVVDNATGLIFRPVFTVGEAIKGDPNTSSIIAAVGGVMIGQQLDETMVGGIPGVFVFDNARAHLADAMLAGYAALGVPTHAIKPGSPWENGTAEAAVNTVETEVWSQLPGYTHAPKTRYGRSLWSDEQLISLEELIAHTVVGIEMINRTNRVSRLDGKTRLEAWRSDPQVIEFADADLVRHAFVKVATTRKVNKKGVHFLKRYYQSPELAGKVGRNVEIRHIPCDESFIDIYLDGHFLCTAIPHESRSLEDQIALARVRTNRIGRAQVIQKKGAAAAREEAERRLIELQEKDLLRGQTDTSTDVPDDSASEPLPAFEAYLQRGTQ